MTHLLILPMKIGKSRSGIVTWFKMIQLLNVRIGTDRFRF